MHATYDYGLRRQYWDCHNTRDEYWGRSNAQSDEI